MAERVGFVLGVWGAEGVLTRRTWQSMKQVGSEPLAHPCLSRQSPPPAPFAWSCPNTARAWPCHCPPCIHHAPDCFSPIRASPLLPQALGGKSEQQELKEQQAKAAASKSQEGSKLTFAFDVTLQGQAGTEQVGEAVRGRGRNSTEQVGDAVCFGR